MRRAWWLTLTTFFLMSAAWALALPPNGTYDEKDHIVRAYAVATGHIIAHESAVDRRGDTEPAFDVPASLLPTNKSIDCVWAKHPETTTAACQQWLAGIQPITTPTGVSRYSPVYYLVVGLPLVASPNLTGLVLARLLSALLASLLVASAVTALLRTGRRLVGLAIALCCTPLTVDLFGSINPNGLEIAAGVLVFGSLLALARAPADRLDERATRRLLLLAALGSLLLLTIRQLGPVWLALNIVACVLLARPGRVRNLRRRRDVQLLLGGAWAAGLAFAIGWLVCSGITDVAPVPRAAVFMSLPSELYHFLTDRLPFFLDQAVGSFDYGETHLARPVVVAWYLLIGALTVPSLLLAARRTTIVAVGLGVAGLAVLNLLDLHFLPEVGWFSQARYAMPTLVGVVLIAVVRGGWEQRLTQRRMLGRYALTLAAAAAAIQVYALARVMVRFQLGLDARGNPLHYVWRPPVGPLPPLLLMLAGAALLTTHAVTTRAEPAHSLAPARDATEVLEPV
jgi:hypothetical protein